MQERLVGFSTGTLFNFLEPTKKESLDFVQDLGCNTAELNWHQFEPWPHKNIGKLINGYFQCTSLHLPSRTFYAIDIKSIAILRRAYKMFLQCESLRYAVIHPELVIDWDEFYQMFDQEFSLPLAIENMDNRKKSFKELNVLLEFFEKYPKIKLVFDVNHWIVNGHTISSISKTIKALILAKVQLAGIHLSGAGFHKPLFKTPDGKEIVRSLRALPPDIPIVIESTFRNAKEPAVELAFVRKYLKI